MNISMSIIVYIWLLLAGEEGLFAIVVITFYTYLVVPRMYKVDFLEMDYLIYFVSVMIVIER